MSGLDYKIQRIRQRLSQWELARLSDIPPYRISAFEQERVQLSPEELERLRTALDQAEAPAR